MSYTTQQDILDFVEDNNVKFVRFAFCDIFGFQKNIAVLASDLPKALEDGVCFDGSAIAGFMHVEESDLLLRPDLSTMTILPWRTAEGRVMQFFCDVEKPDNTPFGGNCRGFLRDINRRFKQLGLRCNVGTECEFYLFENDDRGRPTRIPIDAGGYFDVAPLDAGENIRRDICLTLEAMGIEPQYSQHISGPGQNRIDFAPGPALECADNVITFRSVVKMMAVRNGLWAAFSPKPIPDQAGNGFRIAMRPTQQGESCADAFLAGVLERFQEMQVFFNPREESYERLGTFGAPASVSWADTGRGALLRRKADGRLELSAADGAANPYLAFSLLIYAGVDGVQRGLSPAGLETGQPLAATLGEAKARCKESAFLQGLLPREILRAYTGR